MRTGTTYELGYHNYELLNGQPDWNCGIGGRNQVPVCLKEKTAETRNDKRGLILLKGNI